MKGKEELLTQPIEHIDIKSFDANPIIKQMGKMSFTARDTARAADLFEEMLRDPDCAVILTIAGSTGAGGCLDLYAELIRANMVDAVVSTGASIVDMDFFEAIGAKHYRGDQLADDETLRAQRIDRIYDTYIDEDELQRCDHAICSIAESLPAKPHSSREFIRAMGQWLLAGNAVKNGSLVEEAARHGVPVFCPALRIRPACWVTLARTGKSSSRSRRWKLRCWSCCSAKSPARLAWAGPNWIPCRARWIPVCIDPCVHAFMHPTKGCCSGN